MAVLVVGDLERVEHSVWTMVLCSVVRDAAAAVMILTTVVLLVISSQILAPPTSDDDFGFANK